MALGRVLRFAASLTTPCRFRGNLVLNDSRWNKTNGKLTLDVTPCAKGLARSVSNNYTTKFRSIPFLESEESVRPQSF